MLRASWMNSKSRDHFIKDQRGSRTCGSILSVRAEIL